VWPYFEAALVAPPACALPGASSVTATIASAPVMVALYIAASIRSGTTQTKQALTFPKFDVSYSMSLFGVLLSLEAKMIPSSGKRNNQSFDA
jgi:hypothetical protein